MATMDIPYGFDCYTFEREQIKWFERNLSRATHSVIMKPAGKVNGNSPSGSGHTGAREIGDYIKFTRKNEDYPKEQVLALGQAGRLNMSEADKRIFCGIKIQIGIAAVAAFLRQGLLYRAPIKGRAELVNGSWTGIVKGLTVARNSSISYDVAFGNFLAWDEEIPYIKFGPFFAIESKLVMLTGGSRRIETSSFGTNITADIWFTILSLLIILSLLASIQIDWRETKCQNIEEILEQLSARYENKSAIGHATGSNKQPTSYYDRVMDFLHMSENFLFIYYTMLLNKPSVEFDELIWPKQPRQTIDDDESSSTNQPTIGHNVASSRDRKIDLLVVGNEKIRNYYKSIETSGEARAKRQRLPTTIRVLSYLWSAICFVMASIFSGEMLAVMLLHADQNIDTIVQLINSKPPIEPVIRQDDFTYTLMLKSLDQNMLKLHNKTRIIPRSEVYSRRFIEAVSERKYALLGDDELIETIYDIYHKYYPLYKSKMTYLQYPISLIYRKDLNSSIETKLRSGLVQMFEMGLVHRWYQAQKDTYIKFYDTYERKATESKDATQAKKSATINAAEQKYKPLSMGHFKSFLRTMFYCFIFAFVVLIFEILHSKAVPR